MARYEAAYEREERRQRVVGHGVPPLGGSRFERGYAVVVAVEALLVLPLDLLQRRKRLVHRVELRAMSVEALVVLSDRTLVR